MPNADFDILLDEGIEDVFFEEMAENVTRGTDVLRVIYQHGVEVEDEAGTIDMVSYAITCRKRDFKRNDTFIRERDGRQWQVGRLLTRDLDDRVQTYEIVAV